MSNINLIARDNGAGLTRDMHLLAGLLREGGHDVTITGLGHRSRLSNRLRRLHARLRRLFRGWFHGELNARYDMNIMLEHVRPESFDQAHVNILIPNPEWFREEWLRELPHIDLIFAKTQHAEQIFGKLGCRVVPIGFTGSDYQDREVARQATFFHGPGRSGNKGTLPLLELWAQHPEWPELTVVWRRKRVELPELPPNVKLIRDYLPEAELRRLHNANVFHLCPSQTEGYGHSLVESLSTGCVTITTDAEPMNELVTAERGVLVAAHANGTQELATLYDFDLDAMRVAIERCIAMPKEEQASLGRAARAWYEHNNTAFRQRFLDAIANAAPPARNK
ncbi:glycosyltransferase [Dyella flava]|uniref:Glycosyltransferase n=1 Tax=Dyella flava TaxID=1920170 RepID=A0ABS2JZG6_9GAMM|nr:glycosyltransferase [Dyella flava]MBM7124383.1 glycosyltransferase [Dyella flava]GLQ52469.1 glycosyl transferase [Dyella flava]